MLNIERRELKKFQNWYVNQPEAKDVKNNFLREEEREKILMALYERFKEEQKKK
jgi:hypothetical protein